MKNYFIPIVILTLFLFSDIYVKAIPKEESLTYKISQTSPPTLFVNGSNSSQTLALSHCPTPVSLELRDILNVQNVNINLTLPQGLSSSTGTSNLQVSNGEVALEIWLETNCSFTSGSITIDIENASTSTIILSQNILVNKSTPSNGGGSLTRDHLSFNNGGLIDISGVEANSGKSTIVDMGQVSTRRFTFKNTTSSSFTGDLIFTDSLHGNITSPEIEFLDPSATSYATLVATNATITSLSAPRLNAKKRGVIYHFRVENLAASESIVILSQVQELSCKSYSRRTLASISVSTLDVNGQCQCDKPLSNLNIVTNDSVKRPQLIVKRMRQDTCLGDTIRHHYEIKINERFVDATTIQVNFISRIGVSSLSSFDNVQFWKDDPNTTNIPDSIRTTRHLSSYPGYRYIIYTARKANNDKFIKGEIFYLTFDESLDCPDIESMARPINAQHVHAQSIYIHAHQSGRSCLQGGSTDVRLGVEKFKLTQKMLNPIGTLGNGATTTIKVQNSQPLLVHVGGDALNYDSTKMRLEIEIQIDPGLVFENIDSAMFDLVDDNDISNRISPMEFRIEGQLLSAADFWNNLPTLGNDLSNCPKKDPNGSYPISDPNCKKTITIRYDLNGRSPAFFKHNANGRGFVSQAFKDFFDNFHMEYNIAGCCICYEQGDPNQKATISQAFYIIRDVDCESNCRIPISEVSDDIIINCPGCIVPGWNITNMEAERLGPIGWVDTDGNSYPDILPSGAFDTSPAPNPNRNNIIWGDTVSITINGAMSDGDAIKGFTIASMGNNFFEFGEFLLTGAIMQYLELAEIRGRITNNNLTGSPSNFFTNTSTTPNGTAGEFIIIPTFDASGNLQTPQNIQHDGKFQMMLDENDWRTMLGNTGLSFRYGANDEIELQLKFRVKENINCTGSEPFLTQQFDLSSELNISGTDFGWRTATSSLFNDNQSVNTSDTNMLYAMNEFGNPKPEREEWANYYYFCTGYESRITGVEANTVASVRKSYPSWTDGLRNVCRASLVYESNGLAGVELLAKSRISLDPFPNELRNFWMLDHVEFQLPQNYTYANVAGIKVNSLDLTSNQLKANSDWSGPGTYVHQRRTIDASVHHSNLNGSQLLLDATSALQAENNSLLAHPNNFGGMNDRSFYGENKIYQVYAQINRDGCPEQIPLEPDNQSLSINASYANTEPSDLNRDFNFDFNDEFRNANIRLTGSVVRIDNNGVRLNLGFSRLIHNVEDFATPNGFILIESDLLGPIDAAITGVDTVIVSGGQLFHQFPYFFNAFKPSALLNINCEDLASDIKEIPLRITYGYSCTGLVENLEDACDVRTFDLVITLDEVGLNASYAIPETITSCDTTFYEIRLDAEHNGIVANVNVSSSIPNGINFVPDADITLDFPQGASAIIDPQNIIWNSAANQVDVNLEGNLDNFNGLDNDRTEAILRIPIVAGCDYEEGNITVDVEASNFCGRTIAVEQSSILQIPSIQPNAICCPVDTTVICQSNADFIYTIDDGCGIVIMDKSINANTYNWTVTESGTVLHTSVSSTPNFDFIAPFPKSIYISLSINQGTDCEDTMTIPVYLNCCETDTPDPCADIQFGIKSSSYDLENCTYTYVLSRSANFPTTCRSIFEVLDDAGDIVESFVANASETTFQFKPEKAGVYTVRLAVICGEGDEAYYCEAKSYTFCYDGCDACSFEGDLSMKKVDDCKYRIEFRGTAPLYATHHWTVTGPNNYSAIFTNPTLDFSPPINGDYKFTLHFMIGEEKCPEPVYLDAGDLQACANNDPCAFKGKLEIVPSDKKCEYSFEVMNTIAGAAYRWVLTYPDGTTSPPVYNNSPTYTFMSNTTGGVYKVEVTVTYMDGRKSCEHKLGWKRELKPCGKINPCDYKGEISIKLRDKCSYELQFNGTTPANVSYEWQVKGPNNYAATFNGMPLIFSPPTDGSYTFYLYFKVGETICEKPLEFRQRKLEACENELNVKIN